MINIYYFTHRKRKIAFNTVLDTHHINHTLSQLTITPKNLKNEKLYVNKIKREMAKIYARLMNQYKIKYQTVFSARFYKLDEDDEILDEIELYINLSINQSLADSDVDINIVKSHLKHQVQNHETKDCGWNFDEIKSMTIHFHKITELNGSNYLNFPFNFFSHLIF